MNWDKIPNEERLLLWRELRKEINSQSHEDQLDKVIEFCSTMPRGRRTLDYYNPVGWPTPWEILFHGEFCKSSVSLIIFYTLALLNKEQDIELWVVKDNDGDYLLPVINGQIILNYEIGKVSKYLDVCDCFIVMQKFSKEQIKAIK